MKICPVNENSVIIYFAGTHNAKPTPEIADEIARSLSIIQQEMSACIIDVVPSYTSVFISFDLMTIGHQSFVQRLQYVLDHCRSRQAEEAELPLIELPVYYGPEVALDAKVITDHTGLSFEEVINIHASTLYRVYAIGFAPGFAYLGNTDQRIAVPRKKTPRLRVPTCSVALAERQTAIYPRESPGGWQIIGRSPVSPIDYQRKNLSLFEVGAKVKFTPVSKAAFLDMGGAIFPEGRFPEGRSPEKQRFQEGL
ncbi:allophanate hydrolase subunit 1 [Endozoicomonas gorgoniicola]|uniref:Allophanate hydrolase subunit 1 n=1 Tax=Endozoicomonas gorgoniicola TaxID=1234144 RepID=A0ABT3N2J9_9GAMM|nr:allophanate hydrolase subunit 1 [Endozoicomonas gorgoniicola]MCW7555862.1 allophanate hydrolase subunit 1 [Endozoicomonas gorgoniicola]